MHTGSKPMADLIERLRQPAVFAEPAESQRCHLVMASAADALESLQRENERMKHDLDRQMTIANEHVNEVERLREVERASFYYIDRLTAVRDGYRVRDLEEAHAQWLTARAALAAGEGGDG